MHVSEMKTVPELLAFDDENISKKEARLIVKELRNRIANGTLCTKKGYTDFHIPTVENHKGQKIQNVSDKLSQVLHTAEGSVPIQNGGKAPNFIESLPSNENIVLDRTSNTSCICNEKEGLKHCDDNNGKKRKLRTGDEVVVKKCRADIALNMHLRNPPSDGACSICSRCSVVYSGRRGKGDGKCDDTQTDKDKVFGQGDENKSVFSFMGSVFQVKGNYCKCGYFCWVKILRKCWQDISRWGNFHNTAPYYFIKALKAWFNFRVG